MHLGRRILALARHDSLKVTRSSNAGERASMNEVDLRGGLYRHPWQEGKVGKFVTREGRGVLAQRSQSAQLVGRAANGRRYAIPAIRVGA